VDLDDTGPDRRAEPDQKPVDRGRLTRTSRACHQGVAAVLGVTSTLPIWAENKYNEILSKYVSKEPSPNTLRQLRSDLINAGLGEQLPHALDAFIGFGEEA
jgi:hypothetical protein